MGDPLALLENERTSIGGVVWPSEVDAEIQRVDGIANSVDATIKKCYPDGHPKRVAWDATLSAWRNALEEMKRSSGWSPWFGPFAGYFGRGGMFDLAQDFERRFGDFANQAAADGCQGSPPVKPRADRDAESTDRIASAVKYAAVGAVAIAAVVALKTVL